MGKGFVDFHSHILPLLDHGAITWQHSLEQAEHALSAGVETIVATSHFYLEHESITDFLARREEASRLLDEHLQATGTPLHIIPAAEVTLYVDLLGEDLSKLCIGDTRYILLELPMVYWTDWVYQAVYEIQSTHQLLPIIAHIDRYETAQLERLLAMGPLAQVNASAFRHRATRRRMMHYIREGMIHFLGSDAHGDGKRAYADFQRAISYIHRHVDNFMAQADTVLVENCKGLV